MYVTTEKKKRISQKRKVSSCVGLATACSVGVSSCVGLATACSVGVSSCVGLATACSVGVSSCVGLATACSVGVKKLFRSIEPECHAILLMKSS